MPVIDLHPGLDIAIRRFGFNETDVAKAIASGELTSPQDFANSVYFAIRITGVGAAYRSALEEHVWRDPSIYLNQAFLDRCRGLPVIVEHPPKQMLDTKEYNKRNIGTIVHPYILGDEVWGIARIIDMQAAEIMKAHQLSTSPAVVFLDPSVNETVNTDDGKHLLIEGDPGLLDHICICAEGVWDKMDGPTGVDLGDGNAGPVQNSESLMNSGFLPNGSGGATADSAVVSKGIGHMEEEKEDKRSDRMRDDMMDKRDDKMRDDKMRDDTRLRDDAAKAEQLDKLMNGLINMGSRLDAMCERMDMMDKRHDKMMRDDRMRDDMRRDDKMRDDMRRDDEDPKHEERQAAELERLAAEEREEGKEGKEGKPVPAVPDSKRKDTRKDMRMRDDKMRDDEEMDEPKETIAAKDKKRHDAEEEEERKDMRMRKDKMRDDEEEGEYAKGDRMRDDKMMRDDKKRDDWMPDDDWKRGDRMRDDKMRDDARMDAAAIDRLVESKLADLRRQIEQPSDETRASLADAQARADDVYGQWGKQAPHWLAGETVQAYRARLLRPMQEHSKDWKDESLIKLASNSPGAFDTAERMIYADAAVAARQGVSVPAGHLHKRVRIDHDTGQRMIEWHGKPSAWMNQFMPPFQVAVDIGRKSD